MNMDLCRSFPKLILLGSRCKRLKSWKRLKNLKLGFEELEKCYFQVKVFAQLK